MNHCVITSRMLKKIWFSHLIINLILVSLLYPYQSYVTEVNSLERLTDWYQQSWPLTIATNSLIILGIGFSIWTVFIPNILKRRIFKKRLSVCNEHYSQKFHALNLSSYLFQWALLEIITLIGLIYVNMIPNRQGFGVFILFFGFSILFSFIRKPAAA